MQQRRPLNFGVEPIGVKLQQREFIDAGEIYAEYFITKNPLFHQLKEFIISYFTLSDNLTAIDEEGYTFLSTLLTEEETGYNDLAISIIQRSIEDGKLDELISNYFNHTSNKKSNKKLQHKFREIMVDVYRRKPELLYQTNKKKRPYCTF